MIFSWIKQFIRVSWRGKFYTITNTLGLAVGLTCTIIILLWADFQKSYDKFHPDYQKIFQVYEVQSYADGYQLFTYSTPSPLAGFLNTSFPEIEHSVRFTGGTAILGLGERAFRENELGFTDSTFFSIFKVEFVYGSESRCLNDLNSIVLSEKLANKLFGKTDVIGQSVRFNGRFEFNVTAVIKDYPKNSNIHFSCLIPFDKLKDFGVGGLDQWGWNSYSTFIRLNKVSQIDTLEKVINREVVKKGVGENTQMKLQPLEMVRLHDPDPNGFSLVILVAILLSISGFVMLLACINFINLVTARAANRAKEVGIRKVVGSSRWQLIAQYFLESFLTALVSLLIAIILVDLALPAFNATLSTELKMNFLDYIFWFRILLVVLGVGIVSGFYPAIVLSSFRPAQTLKGIIRTGARGAGFRKTMVIVQYTITIFLVVVTFYMFKHLSFINNVDTGMSRKNVISMPFRDEMKTNYKSFKDELLKIPSIKYVVGVQHLPFQIYSSTSNFDWSGKDTMQSYLFSNTMSDEFLTDAMEIKMLEGRFFSSQYPSDTLSIVINETAAGIINKQPILGEVVKVWGQDQKIIGVMKDFHFTHFSGKIQPLFILYSTSRFNSILIKCQNTVDSQTLDGVKSVFTGFYPDYPFESTSLDDSFDRMFAMEKQVRSLLGEFTILAILISCVGLLSLAAFIAEQQRKSLVLRKIHGANMIEILTILIGSFTKWVLISGVIALPLSYIGLNALFRQYAFHADFSWWIFAGALGAALVIAIITILYQALKTARLNPVETLRYE